MYHYKVKALVEVEYDAEYLGKMASALEGAENSILTALSKLEFLSSCEFKKVKIHSEDDETFTATLDAKFAWAADAEELSALCKKYSVDMKLYAFEKGMGFNQDILIVGKEILRDNRIAFEDYNWECICPTVGG